MSLRAALLLGLSLSLPGAVLAGVTTRHVRDAAGDDIEISCRDAPIGKDYVADTSSGVPLQSAYAREHDADKGLVRLMNQGGRPAMRYAIPSHLVRAEIRVKAVGAMGDYVDLVFTASHLSVVDTSTADAGVFQVSDVYVIPFGPSGRLDTTRLRADPDLLSSVRMGLSAYDPAKGRCRAAP